MKILVVSPHPDDETLGAGGTLLKMKKKGHQIFWLNITDMNENGGWSIEEVSRRQGQIEKVKAFYGFHGFYNLSLPPTKLMQIDEEMVIAKIRVILNEVAPEWLMLPGQYDAHSDHKVVYNCCMAGAKTFRAPYIRRVTTMEILSETEYGFQQEKFEPNLFVDITKELEDKLTAMKIYDTEIEEVPFPRSLENIKALAAVRGGACRSRYAEAFYIVKQME